MVPGDDVSLVFGWRLVPSCPHWPGGLAGRDRSVPWQQEDAQHLRVARTMWGWSLLRRLRGDGSEGGRSPAAPGASQHPGTTSSRVGKTLSPPAEPGASGPPGDAPPGHLGRGGRGPLALPGPDAVLPGAPLGAGQGESSLVAGRCQSPRPGQGLLGEQPPAVCPHQDPQSLGTGMGTSLQFSFSWVFPH